MFCQRIINDKIKIIIILFIILLYILHASLRGKMLGLTSAFNYMPVLVLHYANK